MKFSTFYFSGTGNTEWIVQQLNQIIIKRGHESQIIPISDTDAQKTSFLIDIVRNSDFIGFANPIYGADIPPIMKNFIDKLVKAVKNEKSVYKPVYIINTFAYVNGFGPFCAKRLFKNNGFKLISYINIRLCNNISSPKLKVKPISKEKLEKRKATAEEKLVKAIDMLLSDKSYITGIGPYLVPGILIRKKTIKAIEDNYKALSVDNATCRKCMSCVNNCPAKSIEYTDGCFSFLPTCTSCMRCYNNCPTFSILFDGKYADPDIYERYRGPSG